MTAPAITLSSPTDLLAVIPRLLGFEPHASIVVLSLRRRLGLTQRMDLPGPPLRNFPALLSASQSMRTAPVASM